MQAGLDPRELAKLMARPIQNMSSSQQQYLTVHMGSSLTVSEVQRMIAENNEQWMQTLTSAFG